MIWLLTVNDINQVNKVKNQTTNLSFCFLHCILHLRTDFLKLGSSLRCFTVVETTNAHFGPKIAWRLKLHLRILSSKFFVHPEDAKEKFPSQTSNTNCFFSGLKRHMNKRILQEPVKSVQLILLCLQLSYCLSFSCHYENDKHIQEIKST